MNIKETMSGIGVGIIPIALIALWINGCNHGTKKHDVDPWSSNFFVCWYYGAEKFWHKTDTTELNDNIRVATYLLMWDPQTTDPKKQLDYNEAKKLFKKILASSEGDELKYIKEGAKTYLDFKNKFEEECYDAMLNCKLTKVFTIHQSDSSILLAKKLSKYGLDKEMKELSESMEKLNKAIQEKLDEDPDAFNEKAFDDNTLKASVDKGIEERKILFDNLFS